MSASPPDPGSPTRPLVALGIISGTSADGIDVGLVRSDGEQLGGLGPSLTAPYRPELRAAILERARRGRAVVPEDAVLGQEVARDHAAAATRHLAGLPARWRPDLVGFHGQTVFHDPDRGQTTQLGDAALAARLIGLPVIADLRLADLAHGGQGAPLVPLYHAALARFWRQPAAILNIGGVSNLTYVHSGAPIAFDIGPGNALIDDWTARHTGRDYDADGVLAAGGTVDRHRLATALDHPFFRVQGPKSLDRYSFTLDLVEGLNAADGAATLTALAAAAVARSVPLLPLPPSLWVVCGGGRLNLALMARLRAGLAAPVVAIEALGLDGDSIEAQAMAFLAIRSRLGLPLTVPSSTGVSRPMPGGRLVVPDPP